MTTKERAIEMAQDVLNDLEDYTTNGLPDCYESVHDWLCDFYPDLPWDESGRNMAIDHMLRPQAWSVLNSFSERIGFDMTAELKRVRADEELN